MTLPITLPTPYHLILPTAESMSAPDVHHTTPFINTKAYSHKPWGQCTLRTLQEYGRRLGEAMSEPTPQPVMVLVSRAG
jgi:hypothetical protein